MMEAYALGFMLGFRHALEPDHLAAVSTLVATRKSRFATWLGICWGAGHSLSLLLVAGALVLLERQMPSWLSSVFELGVSAMLMGLGIKAIRQAMRDGQMGQSGAHAHGEKRHTHAGPPSHVHLGRRTLATRPLWIGLVHGLAGSGAMTALVMAHIPSASARLAYIALFGLGSTVAMALLTGLAGARLARLSSRRHLPELILGFSGGLSLALGCFWAAHSLKQLV